MAGTTAADAGVLVVGAGPVGLALACALRLQGVPCTVVDDGDGPTPLSESRALAVWARTLEVFDRLGVVGRVLSESQPVRRMNLHAGGRKLAELPLELAGLDTPYPVVVILPQGRTERALLDRLEGQGGGVDWRTKLTDLSQDATGVTATLEGPGGQARTARAGWLVGCDGARSAVRHALGLKFEGAEYEELFLLADVRVGWDLPGGEMHAMLQPGGGAIAAFPLPGADRWRLVDATGVLGTDDPAQIVGRFGEAIRASGHPEARVDDPSWTSAFRLHRRIADRFRVGRVFVAGDAAHIHSPAGGQGMNTGIQDAFNLAWKLALVNSGRASGRLLDSYQAERRPVAAQVLRMTDVMTRVVTLRNPVLRAVRNGLVGLLGEFAFVRRQGPLGLSELRLSYPNSPIVGEDRRRPVRGPGPGERAPDVMLGPGPDPDGPARWLSHHLDATRHHLLLFTGPGEFDAEPARLEAVGTLVADEFPDLIRPWLVTTGDAPPNGLKWADGVIPDPTGAAHRSYGAESPILYLIRPDGYVGYRALPPDPQALRRYVLQRVLGGDG